jgi:hypothetical protein
VWVRQVLGRSVTDTTDSALHGNPANKENYGNCTRRTDSLVTRSNTGFCRGSAAFIDTGQKWR